ncbi:glycoside hydrolase family 3 protein [Legionella fairfieldensis]|uniref:glycoside hydrolase family 3 protein n=1 Tax=Legionella fairfieldensis TaxID=45064 RepID=UPI00048B3A86|nr:glycoside hydrolase family 3 N-terminal domain-containing protein [Legionella fairfieldensis]
MIGFKNWLMIVMLLTVSLASVAGEISLRDKIGQMLIIGFEGKHVDKNSPIIKAINENNIGGVILFDYNYRTNTFDKNIANPEQLKKLNQDLQSANTAANKKYHRPQLPLLISIDHEGGAVNRLKESDGFPATISAAETGKMNTNQAEQIAESMSKTLEDAGFNLNFAPALDVDTNPTNPIISQLGRSFSAKPSEVARFAGIYSRHFLHHAVQCAYKHFPGHGSAKTDSHLTFVDVTDSWQALELEPYKQLLGREDSCGMVMTAHIVNRLLDESGLPATLSHKMLTELLRERLQFEGVIITDDMQMKAISEHFSLEQALTLAINAGADMFIFGNQLTDKIQDPKEVIDLIEAKVKSGEINPSRIDKAYEHITAFKNSIQRNHRS